MSDVKMVSGKVTGFRPGYETQIPSRANMQSLLSAHDFGLIIKPENEASVYVTLTDKAAIALSGFLDHAKEINCKRGTKITLTYKNNGYSGNVVDKIHSLDGHVMGSAAKAERYRRKTNQEASHKQRISNSTASSVAKDTGMQRGAWATHSSSSSDESTVKSVDSSESGEHSSNSQQSSKANKNSSQAAKEEKSKTESSISARESISASNALSASESQSQSASLSQSASISQSQSASVSAVQSVSVSQSQSLSASVSQSASASTSTSISESTSASRAESAKSMARSKAQVESSASASQSASNSLESIANSIADSKEAQKSASVSVSNSIQDSVAQSSLSESLSQSKSASSVSASQSMSVSASVSVSVSQSAARSAESSSATMQSLAQKRERENEQTTADRISAQIHQTTHYKNLVGNDDELSKTEQQSYRHLAKLPATKYDDGLRQIYRDEGWSHFINQMKPFFGKQFNFTLNDKITNARMNYALQNNYFPADLGDYQPHPKRRKPKKHIKLHDKKMF